MKKAISAGTSAALLASLLATAVAPSVAAASLTTVVYGPTGTTAGGTIGAGLLLTNFTPITAVGSGTTITVTLPATSVIAAAASTVGNWTIQQAPGAAANPSSVVPAGSGGATPTLQFTVALASLGTPTNAISITAAGAAPTLITNPTTASAGYQACVTTQAGDNGCVPVSFVAGKPTAAQSTFVAVPTSVPGDGTSTSNLTVTLKDVNSNVVAGKAVSIAVTGGSLAPSGFPKTGTTDVNGQVTVTAGTEPATGTTIFTATDTTDSVAVTQTPTVTWTAVPASVTCTPSGGPVAVGGTVTCAYNAGSTGTTVAWTATNFTPGSSGSFGPSFTAVNAGLTPLTGTITATGSAGGATATFSYTIAAGGTPPPPIPPATPGTITATGNSKSVPRGGTTWIDPLTYTFTEGSVADWTAGNSVTVCFADKNGTPVSIKGGTLAGPDSLAFTSSSYSVSGNCFTVKLGSTAADNTRIEAFTVSGLLFKASTANVPGAISATYTDTMGVGCGLGACTVNPVYFGSNAATATGTLAGAVAIGATWITVNLNSGSTPFVTSTALNGEGKIVVNSGGSNTESFYGTVGAPGNTWNASCPNAPLASNQQCIQLVTPALTANTHSITEPVSQSVLTTIGTLPSPGTIVDALSLNALTSPQLLVGVTNQTPGQVTLGELAGSTGLLAKGTVITLKISEPGVLFSALPTFAPLANGLALGSGTLSLDRTTATFTVTAADTAPTTITFSMNYDVAPNATTGDAVNLAVTAGSIAIVTSPVINAYIGSTVFLTSTAPTVFINVNDQAEGKAVITETAAASIGSAAGNNTVYACLTTGESWTRAPWLVRTAGDILITNPNLLTGGSQAVGTQTPGSPNCYQWAVYTASTKASTLEIQGVDASGNPTPTARISVPNGLQPGPVFLSVWINGSNSALSGNLLNIVTVAVRAFQFGITLSADGQPYVAPGSVSAPAGNLTIAQTGPNLLVAGEQITCLILPLQNQDYSAVNLAAANQNLLPVVSTDGATSGLQAHFVSSTPTSFTLMVDQGATVTPGGKIYIKNINYTTTADAALGPIIVECGNGLTASHTTSPKYGAAFDQFVSNAISGTQAQVALNISAVSALGLNPTSGYSTKSLKVQAKGKYVTWKFSGGAALAGQSVKIWVTAAVVPGVWGAWKPLTIRVADANGIATFWWKSATAASISVRAEWMGNATYGDSLSPARGVTWH